MHATQLYKREDISRWVSANNVAKGLGYLSRVQDLDIGPYTITARVKGTAHRPYDVSIFMIDSPSKVGQLDAAFCTCPVGYGCKHIAAVLMATLNQRNQPTHEQHHVGQALAHWIEETRSAVSADTKKSGKPPSTCLYYLLSPSKTGNDLDTRWHLSIYKSRRSENPTLYGHDAWYNIERALIKPPAFMQDDDIPILQSFLLAERQHGYRSSLGLDISGRQGDQTLELAAKTGRLYEPKGKQLRLGEARRGQLHWEGDTGRIRPLFHTEPRSTAVMAETLWYLDQANAEIGHIEHTLSATTLSALIKLPPLQPNELSIVSSVLQSIDPNLDLPQTEGLPTLNVMPVPVLELGTLHMQTRLIFGDYPTNTREFDYATLSFRYGEHKLPEGDNREFFTSGTGQIIHLQRDHKQEQCWITQLAELGLMPLDRSNYRSSATLLGLASEAKWPGFVADAIPALQAEGWEVIIPTDFRHNVLEVTQWEADVSEDNNGWFDLDLGIVVDGQRLSLAPLLFQLFRRNNRWLDPAQLNNIPDNEEICLHGPKGSRISVQASRIKPLSSTLIDLFDNQENTSFKVSRFDTLRLTDAIDNAHWQTTGVQHAREIAERIRSSQGLQPVAPPKGFVPELRPYQLDGLSWLQYLHKNQLSGILADDMGLGKTAQTLAHLLLEKESGRLNKPALVVLPTSLIFNWRREASRFAPDLRILSLHGQDRMDEFTKIATSDVVLTTYPLLWRDENILTGHEYHLLILDEAQTVKNAGSKAAQVVRKLRSQHRLCITGTPLENHLGELWSQFDFLLPGFLGDLKGFTRTWRTPIEKHGDVIRRDLLAKRIKPFILRRRKEDVATELPPKTIIVRTVDLEGGQRDLYETVRSMMDKRVMEEIANKGFARSQIVILDALLKLRQVCCDPRLLKLPTAKRVKERAKLDLLMNMLPQLVDEGKRILVFSQFTSMLALIEEDLKASNLDYVLLTGDTIDREGVITRFEAGTVPIFLISLKAGGVGLNLTSADTVIHFDPWWNPAVENQATDRAHRLGQTKNVFVYKLVVAGSIEEKILNLQEKKADLAASVLSEDGGALSKFGMDDLSALLAPLPAS